MGLDGYVYFKLYKFYWVLYKGIRNYESNKFVIFGIFIYFIIVYG